MTDNVESVEQTNKMYSGSDIKGWGVRHTQCILLFLTLSCAYLVRSFMAVALVAMVHNENTQMKNNMSISYSYIGIDNSTNTSNVPISKEDFKLDGIFNTMLIIPPRIFPVPWRKILSCPGLVAIVASHIGFTWGKLTILTEIPSYMDKVMGVNIKTVNHVDISPNFAGTMMSISNFVGNAIGSLSPVVAGLILTDVTNPLLWRQVFFISAGFYFITNLFYLIFGTGELAEWNDPTCYNEVPLHETTKIETDAANLESDQLL
ncbi:unnamed protein product [Diatraea saccharalis]|uniref:Inorganic phosphate cotransporter n=1 Tax=Diatraea saccharalis TaxID=40085 RepID=A0A9N9QZE8_9NEOP|nr:unnamed protein product [Diatraea saccharalis]